jgi:rubrerythrin
MSDVESTSRETIENLITAYSGERNAAARYIAFAVQADKEGYFGVGSLFRAVAHSEQVHATNHARVLLKYGAELSFAVQPLEVRTTLENLRSSFRGEMDEREQMYPAFARQAAHDDCVEAKQSFRMAAEGEAVHAMLFITAMESIDEYRKRSPYDVCMNCGWVCSGIHFRRCVFCDSQRDRFEQID